MQLRPETIALVDAFDISDTVLNSALGSYDGRVYEQLFESARTSAMNVDHQGGAVLVPPSMKAVEKYLSKEFLEHGRVSTKNTNAKL